jgi:hypothetical protein
MKKITFALLVLGIILTSYSCKKSPADPIVEYQISPADNYIIEINYNDQSGNLITINSISQFANGVKDITVSKKPFTAKFKVQVNNTAAFQMPYSLVIYVDGKIKAYTQFMVPPNSIFSSDQLEYVVN